MDKKERAAFDRKLAVPPSATSRVHARGQSSQQAGIADMIGLMQMARGG